MKRSLLSIFFLLIVTLAAVAQPRISSNKETHNFGQIEWKRPVTVEYTITNTGNQPLVLTNVTTSCACAVADWTKEPIAPGAKGIVKASFDAKALGRFEKSVGIYSNATPNLVYLKFTGEVVQEMKLLGSIFDKLVSVGVLALIILFQDDIRRFLVTLGSHKQLGRFFRFLTGNKQEKTEKADIMPIVLACMSMSKGKVGALIVIEKSVPLNDIIRTGEIINANVNQRLIENIFFKNSPLHDGAMIIRHKRIEAAGCILPVSHDLNIPKELGLRHRAAMGVSQETDALAIIVSEETGGISVAYKGQFHLRLTAEELERILTKED